MSAHAGKRVAGNELGVAKAAAGRSSAAIEAKTEFGLVVAVVPVAERDTYARFRSIAGEAIPRSLVCPTSPAEENVHRHATLRDIPTQAAVLQVASSEASQIRKERGTLGRRSKAP